MLESLTWQYSKFLLNKRDLCDGVVADRAPQKDDIDEEASRKQVQCVENCATNANKNPQILRNTEKRERKESLLALPLLSGTTQTDERTR